MTNQGLLRANAPVGLALLLLSLMNLAAHAATHDRDRAPEVPMSVQNVPNATPKAEPFSQFGNPESYVINGQRYFVKESNKDHIERGRASWYGLKFHGKNTSSGETYDLYAMTAAHKTLPIPTYATVKNLENGKMVLVKINDRGPFVDNRIIDLSYAAAKKLGMVDKGTAPVEVRTITFADNTPFAESHFLQLGVFKSFENAWELRQKAKHIGQNLIHIQVSHQDHRKLYHVKLGPVENQAHHSYVLSELRRLGLPELNHVFAKS